MTKNGSFVTIEGVDKKEERRQAETGRPIAAQQNWSRLDILFWSGLRTGFVVL